MKQLLIFVSVLLFFNCETIKKSEPCKCTQMFTQVDCSKKKDCVWDKSKNKCLDYTYQDISYCSQYKNNEICIRVYSCSWDEDRCTHFTGCTAFVYDTNEKCQAISHRCISDGFHCVEISDCYSYLSPISCINNSAGQYCYWNANMAKCQDADKCSKLPQTLNSDSQCRAQISKCTAKIGGGCVDEGNNCQEQDDQINCVYNKQNNQICFWLDGKCLDKICENAPLTLKTDKQCQDFLPSCTTKQDGGCIPRLLCSTYSIKEACVKDAIGNDCFWTGIKCVDKICENALNTYKKNQQCQDFLDSCITNGKGCIKNTGCRAAIIKDACNSTINGTLCHWNGTACVIKTCTNAGSSYSSHEQCTNYMVTCTVSQDENTGCIDRTCDNAPLSFNTFEQCLNYIQNGNCIPQFGGGCKVNTNCEDNFLKEGCVQDVNGKECYWWNGICKLKTCENAPIGFNTHELCNEFMNTCTVGSDQTCVPLTCDNIQERSNCKFDLNNTPCVYNEGCFQKFCSLAPKYFQKFNECQAYLLSCTVDNSGYGCMELPITCQGITRIEGCYQTARGKKCDWYKGVCVDRSCETAPSIIRSTFDCMDYMIGCVVNNDLAGCMKPSSSCQQRMHRENCLYSQMVVGQNECFWSQELSSCHEIKCENAHLYFQQQITLFDCWNYFGLQCIFNHLTNRCQERPEYCFGLAFEACTLKGVLKDEHSCYWDVDSSQCRAISCTSITRYSYTHDSCQQIMQSCTVNEFQNGCIDLLECSQYITALQCYLSKHYNKCIWLNQQCIDIPCDQIIPSDNFSQCQTISTNCVPTDSICFMKKSRCEDFNQKSVCEQSTINWKSICWWNGWSCYRIEPYQVPGFICSLVKANGLTAQYCKSISQNCSVNTLGSQCIQANYCQDYLEDQCVQGLDGECIWIDNQCKSTQYICEYAKPPYTFDTCSTFYPYCTIKTDGSGCVQKVDSCENTNLENCTNSHNSMCYKKQSENTCISTLQQRLEGLDCYLVQGRGFTVSYCYWREWDRRTGCSVNTAGTSCIPLRYNCEDYDREDECQSSYVGKCIFLQNRCFSFNIEIHACKDLNLYQLEIYTNQLCQEFHYTCKAQPDGSGCYSIENDAFACEKIGQPFSFYNCYETSNQCSVNAAKTQCIPAKNTCGEYSLVDCNHSRDEGECIIVGQSCIQKGCNFDSNKINTYEDCLLISSNCSYRDDGCFEKRQCNMYKLQKSCTINKKGEDCLWNPITQNCLDKTCENAEASHYFDSHEECNQIGRCTVKASINQTIGQGCIPLGSCKSYILREQCIKNTLDQACVWNTNKTPAQCNDKSCETAEPFIRDHETCQKYLNTCTVRVREIDGMYVSEGCISLQMSCNQYQYENQCNFDASGNICGWNGDSCSNQSCNSAPTTINLPQLCQQYLDGCTIHPTNSGCTKIPDTCEEMTQNQCYDGSINSHQQECYWDQNKMKCILKTCDLITISYSEQVCLNFLNYCTMSAQRCRSAICEDYSLTTDDQCRNIMSTCTTNGVYCVKRASCLQAQSEAGCVTDSKGRQCAWINRMNQESHCTIRDCKTAPLNLMTEQQCQEYFQPKQGSCTTSKFGGCILKGTCYDANVQNACTTSYTGEVCFWDDNSSLCRIKQCEDYQGTTHQECKSKRIECTIGLNSKCTKITTCQQTKFKAACIEGTDGPCLWISRYLNKDNSLGACFPYDSCQSFKWSSHEQCQGISNKCTTDGNKCVSITSCEETNLNGGCVIGIDNNGIQKCIVTTESDNKFCRVFNKCTDIHHLTHEECQQASSQCTSDYEKGCIQLQPCILYKQEQCRINHMGIIKDNSGEVFSTGVCIWDSNTSQCRDEDCSDIISTNHFECQSRLFDCTTNGQKCIHKLSCSSYNSKEICENAQGLDGKCFWETGLQKEQGFCRKMNCEDIPNGYIFSSCRLLENCISNGIKCISKAKCSEYNIKQTCQFQGLDGICVWIENEFQNNTIEKCKLMESCESAQKDKNACKSVKEKCYWNSGTSLCQTHTCQTYANQMGKCRNFYSWDNQQIHLCQYHEQQCIKININALTSTDCYIKTAKLYRWDPHKDSCTSCEKSIRLITEFSNILGQLLLLLMLLIN